jgi:probable LLM family oxidoreductase
MVNDEQRATVPEFEFGIYTLGDLSVDPLTGKPVPASRRMKEIIAAAKLADEAGLDVFGVGEHHRLDFVATSPAVVLAAIASVTKRIRLTSATTVLGTSDPVRVFEDFATLDLLSDGRAELIAGRGAYTESFPLFGYELADYRELFLEKLQLLLELNANERLSWSGRLRTPLLNAEIAPRPLQQRLPVWIGVGGTPSSAELAGTLGDGMALAILGGDPARFKPLVDAYKAAAAAAGKPPERQRVAITSHGFIAATSQAAREQFYPHYASYLSAFMGGATGGGALTRGQFEQLAQPGQALAVGSPAEIVEKLLAQHELFGHTRFIAQFDIGAVPYERVAASIELLATKVAPVVRAAIAKKRSSPASVHLQQA